VPASGCADVRTRLALASRWCAVDVLCRECVPLWAMRLARVDCGGAVAAQCVLLLRYHLHVRRVYASPVAAQVVNNQSVGDIPNECLVGDTVCVDEPLPYPHLVISGTRSSASGINPASVLVNTDLGIDPFDHRLRRASPHRTIPSSKASHAGGPTR
jgi:hypothetical protein